MHCFAYGSNMSLARLRARVPSARFVAVAELEAHRLLFHKVSLRDRSAKCDAAFTGDPEDRVLGMVFSVAEAEKPTLDRAEGLGSGYEEKVVEVVTTDGKPLSVRLYYATHTDPALRPYRWYREHVLIGARENNLPEDYIARIEAVEADEDPNRKRTARELAVHQ